MSIFSRIFGIQPKSDDKVESGSPETIRVGEFEKELHVLLDRDAYLARSDYKPLCAKVQQLESFLETFADLNTKESTEIITLHNKDFLEKPEFGIRKES